MKALISDPDQSLEPLVHVSPLRSRHVPVTTHCWSPALVLPSRLLNNSDSFIRYLFTRAGRRRTCPPFYVHSTFPMRIWWRSRCVQISYAVFTSAVAHYSHPACQLMAALSLSLSFNHGGAADIDAISFGLCSINELSLYQWWKNFCSLAKVTVCKYGKEKKTNIKIYTY